MLGTARRDDREALRRGKEVAPAVAPGEDAAFMSERTPTPPAPTVGETTSEAPRLRLAGTNAGPVTDEERQLLELRAEVVLACGFDGCDAGVVRERLGRAGRRDPIEVVRGEDVFARTAAELKSMLAKIDARLAQIDAGRPQIEIDPAASDLLRRS